MAIGVALYSTNAHLIVRPFPRAKRVNRGKTDCFRHENTHPQTIWNYRAAAARGRVVADGNDGGADAVAGGLGPTASDFLCRGRHGLGATGDADRQLDVAAGPYLNPDAPDLKGRHLPGSRAWRASSGAFRPRSFWEARAAAYALPVRSRRGWSRRH